MGIEYRQIISWARGTTQKKLPLSVSTKPPNTQIQGRKDIMLLKIIILQEYSDIDLL